MQQTLWGYMSQRLASTWPCCTARHACSPMPMPKAVVAVMICSCPADGLLQALLGLKTCVQRQLRCMGRAGTTTAPFHKQHAHHIRCS